MRRRGKYDDKDLSFGIESRSLKGCYELMQASFVGISVPCTRQRARIVCLIVLIDMACNACVYC